MKNSSKKVVELFGGNYKRCYLCIRFPQESSFEEAFFERFTISNESSTSLLYLCILG